MYTKILDIQYVNERTDSLYDTVLDIQASWMTAGRVAEPDAEDSPAESRSM